MSERRCFLDEGWGERRGVVTLNGRPERLLIEREGESPCRRLGARVVARVRSVDRSLGLAFAVMAEGPDAVLRFAGASAPHRDGDWIDAEVVAEAQHGKSVRLRLLGAATEGPPRLLNPGPSLAERLANYCRVRELEKGPAARAAADLAQAEVLETEFLLAGGGTIAVERTRACVAIDVDVAGRIGQGAKRVARATNLTALAEAARILRLKGLGGLVVIDLAGSGHDGGALLAAARIAFGPDNPGVAIGPVSRFGTLEIVIPRRLRPTLEILTGDDGCTTPVTDAMALLRALECAADADRGARLTALAPPAVLNAARPFLTRLVARFGNRLSVVEEASLARWRISEA